jgi:hypothetical protein
LPLPLPSESTSAGAFPAALFPWTVVPVGAPPPTDSDEASTIPPTIGASVVGALRQAVIFAYEAGLVEPGAS